MSITAKGLRASASIAIALSAALASPSAAQTSDAGAQDADDIIVTGRRGAIETAAELERTSDVLKSIVTSDDIGQFGDPTVAESLQRIPGVSINRTSGEGQQVSIRGLPTQFATVTVDGARLGTSDADLNSTNLNFISGDNLSQIEVTKTLTPEQDADAIAGAVNLKTISAITTGKDTLGARAQFGLLQKNGSGNPLLGADFTKLFDLGGNRLGVAGSVTWSKRDSIIDDTRAEDGNIYYVNRGTAAAPILDQAASCLPSYVVCYARPREFDFRADQRDAERISVNGTLELEIGDTLLALRGTYARVDADEYSNRQTFSLERSTGSEITALGPDSGSVIDARSERRFRPIDQRDEIYTVGFDGKSGLGDGWRAFYGGYVASNVRREAQIEGRFRSDDIRLTYSNLGSESIDVVLSRQQANRPDPTVPGGYTLVDNRINERFTTSDDKNKSAFVDLEHSFSAFGGEAAVKVGAKYRQRERSFNFDRNEIRVATGIGLAGFDITGRPLNTNLDIRFDTPRGPLEARLRSLVAQGTRLGNEIGNASILESIALDYDAKEDIFAGYAQLTVKPTEALQVIAGVRVERTDYTSTGSRVRSLDNSEDVTSVLTTALTRGGVAAATITDFQRSRFDAAPFSAFSGGNDYTDFLPSLNVRWNVTDKLLARFSYTQGLKRPEFIEAAGVQEIVTREDGLDDGDLQSIITSRFGGRLTSLAQADQAIAATLAGAPRYITEGVRVRNPNLSALKSQNFDMSLGWYPTRNTVLTASAFYKRISNFIVEVGLAGADVAALGFLPDDGTATSAGVARLNTFINGDNATIYGVEIGAYQAFRFLPAPLNGLFVEGNVTFAKSEASAGIVARTFRFPDQSDIIGNLSVGYEDDIVSVRAAGVYQGDRLRAINAAELPDANDPSGDLLEAKRFQLDFSARANVTKQVQVYFDALNVTNAGDRRSFRGGSPAGNGSLFSRIEYYGATYQVGVRAKF